MTAETAGKRLLILGANPETIRLVTAAKRLGVHTTVTDNNPAAAAKHYCDAPLNINAIDVEALVKFVRDNSIDGVLVGVADRLVRAYQQVCQQCALPCFITQSQCELFTDKYAFNVFCKQHCLAPIPYVAINSILPESALADVALPAIVKPSDGCSGKGLSIVRSRDDLVRAIAHARVSSTTGHVLVEQLMDCDDVGLYYTFHRGQVRLSAMFDRFTTHGSDALGRVCVGATYPSQHLASYYKSIHTRVEHMLHNAGVTSGVMLIQAFVREEEFFLYDPGYRLQGEAPDIHVHRCNGVDQCEALVTFALTGNFDAAHTFEHNDAALSGMHAATVWVLCNAGTIAVVSGIDAVSRRHYTVAVHQRLYPGDNVTNDMLSTESRVVARVYVACKTRAALVAAIREVEHLVDVLDPHGCSLVTTSLSQQLPSPEVT